MALSVITLPEAQLERLNRLAARFVLAVLVVALAHTAARLTWRLAAPTPPQAAAPALAAGDAPGPAIPPRADHATRIVRAHLFGEPRAKTPPPQQTVVPETRLNLTLKGVLAAPGEHAIALISSGSGPESLYQVGDRLPGGAMLKEVLPDHVILERNGLLETLRLPKAETAGFTHSGPSAPAAPPPASPPPQRQAGRALARLKQTALRNPRALARMIRATPVEENGQLVGYRVSPGTNRALFSQLGLRPGDVVTAVNGIALTDPDDALSVIQVLNDADEISITVRREDGETTLTHRIE